MKKLVLSLFVILFTLSAQSQVDTFWQSSKAYDGLQFRSVGPATMAGRIADVAIHPDDDNIWYVAVGSGGVWKTINAGVTWTPIFDDQEVYSIGCVTIDPSNPHTIWVGTGENVGGRHVGYGDGIYRSQDGGQTWQNMGLKNSEHLSKIIVHPVNSNYIWVASQGPLWSSGGQRGVYVTEDGGQTWTRTLGNDEWTGATDLVIDPRDPNTVYAATWDRHRTIAAYMGGGPGTALHKSIDGGKTWKKLSTGLPTGNLGKIGLALSPHNPDVLYAAIEEDQRTGGVYKSMNRGESWVKQSSAVSGATGPHYYQELYACPHHYDRIYLVDVRMQVSDDGGKTFRRMKENHKHSDNHALAFRKDDPDYLLVGTDGGLYESYDDAENWRFFANMPITQFYKIAVDDAEPFYNIYGGTQDNSTQGGPSQTDGIQGIMNSDWKVVLNWDGHQPATEPGNPNIVYGQRQQGTLSRIDMATGQVIDIQPQAGKDEPHERFNWDAPILVSPHNPAKIYFASYRLWMSENRGDSWETISGDLTKSQERITLPIMGRVQSVDNAWDLNAMSNFNTITSIAESPVQADLLYIGTDDGLMHVSENGGSSWTKIEIGAIRGIPGAAYVNDIKADLFNANIVYAALDNHKEGDYSPYLIKSTDKGKSWKSIAGNLPDMHLVWRMVQDHVDPQLLFIGTEMGVFFSQNGGNEWIELNGGLPTISTRDLTIQRKEDDLVLGTFGRSIYILDDISVLRNTATANQEALGRLYSPQDAWWYIARSHLGFESGKGDQGSGFFVAENPAVGAHFTYTVHKDYKSAKDMRKASEKKLTNSDIPFLGWEAIDDEARERIGKAIIQVSNSRGEVVRRVDGPLKKGINRVVWDLRFPPANALKLQPDPPALFPEPLQGILVSPGEYSASLYFQLPDTTIAVGTPQSFIVKELNSGSLPGASEAERMAFNQSYNEAVRKSSKIQLDLNQYAQIITRMDEAVQRSQVKVGDVDRLVRKLVDDLADIHRELYGSGTKNKIGEKNPPNIGERLFAINRGVANSTYGPTQMHKDLLEMIHLDVENMNQKSSNLRASIERLYKVLKENGAPLLESLGH